MPAFRSVTQQVFGAIYDADRDRLLQRVALVFGTPALRARTLEGTRQAAAVYGAAVGGRYGRAADDPQLAVVMAAIMGVMTEVIETWVEQDGAGHLPTMIDEALALLEGGLVIGPDG